MKETDIRYKREEGKVYAGKYDPTIQIQDFILEPDNFTFITELKESILNFDTVYVPDDLIESISNLKNKEVLIHQGIMYTTGDYKLKTINIGLIDTIQLTYQSGGAKPSKYQFFIKVLK